VVYLSVGAGDGPATAALMMVGSAESSTRGVTGMADTKRMTTDQVVGERHESTSTIRVQLRGTLERHRRHGYTIEHNVDLLRVTFCTSGHERNGATFIFRIAFGGARSSRVP
jgi:hypothetical protein